MRQTFVELKKNSADKGTSGGDWSAAKCELCTWNRRSQVQRTSVRSTTRPRGCWIMVCLSHRFSWSHHVGRRGASVSASIDTGWRLTEQNLHANATCVSRVCLFYRFSTSRQTLTWVPDSFFSRWARKTNAPAHIGVQPWGFCDQTGMGTIRAIRDLKKCAK